MSLSRILRRQSAATAAAVTVTAAVGTVAAASCAASSSSAASPQHRGGGPFTPTRTLLEKSKRYKHLNPITPDNAINPLGKPLEMDKSALHVVASSIGNVKDFTIRALEVLRQCDYIVCTNRNATKALLNIIDIDFAGRLLQLGAERSFTAHSKDTPNPAAERSSSSNPHITSSSADANVVGVSMQRIVDMLRGGRTMALLTPTGTPCIGDNGTELVKACILNGVRVVTVPGACAATAGLSISGANIQSNAMLATTMSGGGSIVLGSAGGDKSDGAAEDSVTFTSSLSVGATAFGEGSFFFGGQLSEKSGLRARQIRQIRDFSCPVVFYEVPRRLVATLTDMAAILDRKVGDGSANIVADDEQLVGGEDEDIGKVGAKGVVGGNSSSSSASVAMSGARDRSHRKPRRVTVLHEMTKFNESSHSGSCAALLRYYSQLGRSTKLTEVGQLMVVIDGVATSDLVTEELQQSALLSKMMKRNHFGAPQPAASADTNNARSGSFFKSGVFGGGEPTNTKGSPLSKSPSSSSANNSANTSTSATSSSLSRLERKQKRLQRMRKRLIARISDRQAQLEARMIVGREAARRTHEGIADDGPRPLP